ncbi:MAG: hypothetical protein AAF802_05960 [Planctomycetota bacterium]
MTSPAQSRGAKSRKAGARYQSVTTFDLTFARAAFSERVLQKAIKGKRVDTWRLRFLMELASFGAVIGASGPDVESAMLEWLAQPTPSSLKRARLRVLAKSRGYDEAAIECGLSANELLEFDAQIQAFGGDAESLLTDPKTFQTIRRHGVDRVHQEQIRKDFGLPANALEVGLTASELLDMAATGQQLGDDQLVTDPETYRLIRKHGKKRGTDLAYQRGVRRAFGMPADAMKGETAKDLLNHVASAMKLGLDDHLGDSEFWKDYRRLGREALMKKWASGKPVQPKATPKMPEAQTQPKQPERRAESVIEIELVITRLKRVSHDEIKLRDGKSGKALLVIRNYTDGTSELLVSDDGDRLLRCTETHHPVVAGSRLAQPVRKIRRPGATKADPMGHCVEVGRLSQ